MEKRTYYHGTSLTGIKGNKIQARRNAKSNFLYLGKGFYTTSHLEAAKLFSHLAEQQRCFNLRLDPWRCLKEAQNAGLGKIYNIDLSGVNLLESGDHVDSQICRNILEAAKMDSKMIHSLTREDSVSVERISRQLGKYGVLNDNPYECLTRQLGYDGLLIREKFWDSWDYYPSDIGIDFNKFKICPDTAVIYNTEKIKSFKELMLSEMSPKTIMSQRSHGKTKGRRL